MSGTNYMNKINTFYDNRQQTHQVQLWSFQLHLRGLPWIQAVSEEDGFELEQPEKKSVALVTNTKWRLKMMMATYT